MSKDLAPPSHCSRCGAELPTGSQSGVCPACALRIAAAVQGREEGARALDLADIPRPAGKENTPGSPTEKPGDRIGRYKLLQQIGEGGCGVVYMAEQEEPVRRRVALKVIKLGMDTTQVVARFEAERQALALMDHPNIAKVLDAGATEKGRPFFVMELVRGIPVTAYCDENNLDTRQRLELFIQVCRAVQHAHQKGVIHRDLKPSNVLVADHDGIPVPKIIDFGIAKATSDQRLTDKTLFTAFEQFLGTPVYMSPEQARLSGLDIDTRSDIYSLGVLLYELLTGALPFDPRRLAEAGLDEVRRIVRDEEPPKPSTRLSTMGVAEQTTAARHRRAEPPGLIHFIQGDLDWIVMKALEKDRNRRYETASGLAMDIQRHLNTEPVTARPPSRLYRFRKLARRNKLAFSAAAAAVTAFALAGILSAWWAIRATRAEHAKSKSLATAQAAQAAAARERDSAKGQLYDSLVSAAHAARLARQAGYRGQVFELLRQGRALDVPQKSLADLRREAVACLGDFVGFGPTVLSNLPPKSSIVANQVSADGGLAACQLSDGAILLCDLHSGKEPVRLEDEDPVVGFAWSEKGEILTSIHRPHRASYDQELQQASVCRWSRDRAGGEWSKQKSAAPGALGCFCTEQGPVIARKDPDSGSIVLEDRDGKALGEYRRGVPGDRQLWLALSYDRGTFAVVEQSLSNAVFTTRLETTNLKTGESSTRIERDAAQVGDVDLSSDGAYLATTSDAGCSLYRANPLEPLAGLGDFFFTHARIAFCPGSAILALPLTRSHGVRLWDVLRNQEVAIIRVPGAPLYPSFSADGGLLFVSGDKQAWSCPFRSATERLDLQGHHGGAVGVCFSPDGLRIASVGKDRLLKIWNAVDGRLIWATMLPAQGHSVAYSPDGRLIATGYWGTHLVWIWDAATGSRLAELGTNERHITWSLGFTPDGRNLVTASDRGASQVGIAYWGTDTFAASASAPVTNSRPTRSLREGAWSLVLSPNGQHLAFFNYMPPRRLYLWDPEQTDAPRIASAKALSGPQSVGFTPDGHRLLVLNTERKIVTLDAATGDEMFSFPTLRQEGSGSWAEEASLCLSPDGAYLAVASPSRMGVDIWEPESGQLLYELPETFGDVWWLAWSPVGCRLAVARSDGRIAIWNLTGVLDVLNQLGLSPQIHKEARPISSEALARWKVMDLVDSGRWEEALGPLNAAIESVTRRGGGRSRVAAFQAAKLKALESLGRRAEAATARLELRGIQHRPRDCPEELLDLTAHYNWGLEEPSVTGYEGNNLADLPVGVRTLAGKQFDIRGAIWLANGGSGGLNLPEAATGIKVRRKCGTLDLLHGTAFQVADGTEVARLVVHFVDGETRQMPLLYGIHFRNWWEGSRSDPATNTPGAAVVWTGTNPAIRDQIERGYSVKLRLFSTTWENSTPDKEIESLDYVSTLSGSSPFLVAISARSANPGSRLNPQ